MDKHMLKTGIKLMGFGKGIPERCVTNDDLAKVVETSDEWIRERTGIGQRYFINENENVVSMASEAAAKAVADAGIDPAEIGLVLVATFSADQSIPNCASLVQAHLGLNDEAVLAFDMNAACTGFLYALATARALLTTLAKPYAVVVGVETISPLMDMSDRTTCVLFGDGAGAVVLTLDESKPYAQVMNSSGDTAGFLTAPGAASRQGCVEMNGREIYRFAMRVVPQTLRALGEASAIDLAIIDWFVCHQANERIIDGVATRLSLPPERFFRNLVNYGNTSAASIPLALADMREQGLLQPGQKIILAGFGGGLTWGGIYLEY